MKINTHGLPMNGLKKASGETRNYGYYGDLYVQISYNKVTGDIYTNTHLHNEWSEYHNRDIVTVANAYDHMTMQDIADRIYEKVTFDQLF